MDHCQRHSILNKKSSARGSSLGRSHSVLQIKIFNFLQSTRHIMEWIGRSSSWIVWDWSKAHCRKWNQMEYRSGKQTKGWILTRTVGTARTLLVLAVIRNQPNPADSPVIWWFGHIISSGCWPESTKSKFSNHSLETKTDPSTCYFIAYHTLAIYLEGIKCAASIWISYSTRNIF